MPHQLALASVTLDISFVHYSRDGVMWGTALDLQRMFSPDEVLRGCNIDLLIEPFLRSITGYAVICSAVLCNAMMLGYDMRD